MLTWLVSNAGTLLVSTVLITIVMVGASIYAMFI